MELINTHPVIFHFTGVILHHWVLVLSIYIPGVILGFIVMTRADFTGKHYTTRNDLVANGIISISGSWIVAVVMLLYMLFDHLSKTNYSIGRKEEREKPCTARVLTIHPKTKITIR